MSKRFGRNQKRAMRAQIDSALRLSETQKTLKLEAMRQLVSTRDRIHDLERAIELTREVLGEFFVTLPPVTKELHQGVDVLDVPHSQPRDRYMPYQDCAELVGMAMRFEQLEAIRHDIQKHFEDLRGMMHIRFRTGAGTMSYAFSPNSFKGMKRERVASIIAAGLRSYMLDNRAFFDRLGVK